MSEQSTVWLVWDGAIYGEPELAACFTNQSTAEEFAKEEGFKAWVEEWQVLAINPGPRAVGDSFVGRLSSTLIKERSEG